MPWAKLDDGFTDHPKVIAAGPMAGWLYVCGLTYSARLLTDGFIPTGQVRKLADVDGAMELADTLVSVGLWKKTDGGFLINDYLDYNPSAEKVKAERKAAQARMQKLRSGEVRANNERSSGEVRSPRPVPSRPSPVPVPERIEDSHESPLAGSRQPYTQAFEEFWKSYGRTNGPKKPAFTAWQNLSKANQAAASAALPAWNASAKWQDGYKPYPQKYLNQRHWEADAGEMPSSNGHRAEEIDANIARIIAAAKENQPA